MADYNDKNKNLYYLDELSDYKIANDYSDVRGWEVVDANSRTIGKVDNLLVNKNRERVVYLDVEVDDSVIEEGHDPYQTPVSEGIHEFIDKEGENHLIIPIGLASLDENNNRVITNKIDHSTFASAKRFKKGENISFIYEVDTVRHYGADDLMDDDTPTAEEWFYKRREFEYPENRNREEKF